MKELTRLRVLCAVFAVLSAACSGSSDARENGAGDPGPSTSQTSEIDVECPEGDEAQRRRLTTSQELAFDGTVVAVSMERNEAAGWNRPLLDDGQGGEAEPDDVAEIWPWTTFEVHSWFTQDHGTEISIWTAGLDTRIGDRWLVAGAGFATPDGLGDHDEQSGLAAVCATVQYDPEIEDSWISWFGEPIVPGRNLPIGEPDPDTIAAIEEGRQRWADLGITTYSATIRVHRETEGNRGECPADSGAFRLSVVEGEVVEAYNLEGPDLGGGCRVDDPEEVATIDDLFDLATLAAAAADERFVELDDRYGFPLSFSGYDRAYEVYGSVESFVPRPADIAAGEEVRLAADAGGTRWEAAGVRDYRFVIEWRCFCTPEVRGPFEITVEGGAPTSIVHVDGLPLDRVPNDLPRTVDAFIDFVADADGDWLIASFDEELGYPIEVFIDFIVNAVDDELTVVMLEFEPG